MHKLIFGLSIKESIYSVLYALIAAFIVHSAYDIYQKSLSIATVNVTRIVAGFVNEIEVKSNQSFSADQKEKKIRKFSCAMQHVLDGLAKKEKMIILRSEAIIAGAPDLTQDVIVRIKKEIEP
jgi:hypothetical protein